MGNAGLAGRNQSTNGFARTAAVACALLVVGLVWAPTAAAAFSIPSAISIEELEGRSDISKSQQIGPTAGVERPAALEALAKVRSYRRGVPAEFTAISTDPSRKFVSYAWKLVRDPQVAIVPGKASVRSRAAINIADFPDDTASGQKVQLTPLGTGRYAVEVTATDDKGGKAKARVIIAVAEQDCLTDVQLGGLRIRNGCLRHTTKSLGEGRMRTVYRARHEPLYDINGISVLAPSVSTFDITETWTKGKSSATRRVEIAGHVVVAKYGAQTLVENGKVKWVKAPKSATLDNFGTNGKVGGMPLEPSEPPRLLPGGRIAIKYYLKMSGDFQGYTSLPETLTLDPVKQSAKDKCQDLKLPLGIPSKIHVPKAKVGPLTLSGLDACVVSTSPYLILQFDGRIKLPKPINYTLDAYFQLTSTGRFAKGGVVVSNFTIPIAGIATINKFGFEIEFDLPSGKLKSLEGNLGGDFLPNPVPNLPPVATFVGALRADFIPEFRVCATGSGYLLGTFSLSDDGNPNAKICFSKKGFLLKAHLAKKWKGVASVSADVSAQVEPPAWQFYAGAKVTLIFLPKDPTFGVSALLSSRGWAACVDMGFSVGLGMYWGQGLDPYLWGCDVADYAAFPARTARAIAAGDRAITVKPGEQGLVISAKGRNAPPHAVLIAPNGAQYRVGAPIPARLPEDGLVAGSADIRPGGHVAFANKSRQTTYFAIAKPQPGRWTLRSLPGSPEITGVSRAGSLAPVKATGKFTGSGDKRKFRLSTPQVPGQTVRLVERGVGGDPATRVHRTIGTVKARGTGHAAQNGAAVRRSVKFKPALGPSGPREIVAQFEYKGMPRGEKVVRRFRAKFRKTASPVRKLDVGRSGKSLFVKWQKPKLVGDGFEVRLVLSNGEVKLFEFGPRSRGFKLRLRPGVSAKVEVETLDAFGRPKARRRDLFRAPRVKR